MKGIIFNIQKYSIHDGPGIRTTVFLKGCPLKCWWCHNPEGQTINSEILFFKERCTGCTICAKRCPQEAITMVSGQPLISDKKCNLCGICSELCINEAKELAGKEITVEEVMSEIQKDEIFYEESNGGITFSGGEPLLQIDFLEDLLKACKKKGFHTAVDTSGYAKWDYFEQILDYTDLFLYDLKLMNDEKHKKYIGVSNKIILENLQKLSKTEKDIYIRLPIISGINDDNEHIGSVIRFISHLNFNQVNLLPYHRVGMDKYKRLNKNYKLSGMEKPSDEILAKIKNKLKKASIKVKIGG